MIYIVFNPGKNEVSVKGHAVSGTMGKDLVCAAASILVYTLAVNVDNIAEACESREIVLDSGNAEIRCVPKPEYSAVVRKTFADICAGFEILAVNFPGNVTYDIACAGIEKSTETAV